MSPTENRVLTESRICSIRSAVSMSEYPASMSSRAARTRMYRPPAVVSVSTTRILPPPISRAQETSLEKVPERRDEMDKQSTWCPCCVSSVKVFRYAAMGGCEVASVLAPSMRAT